MRDSGGARSPASWTTPSNSTPETGGHKRGAPDAGTERGAPVRDLRHSYATWLVDDGVPPNMVQRVMGHEGASTTLDLYTRRTANTDRILAALSDNDEDDGDDDGQAGALVPV